MSEIDHEYTEYVVCPHCGYEDSDTWDYEGGKYYCNACNNPFWVVVNVSVTYSTEKVEGVDA